MVDRHLMLLLIQRLGPDYVVWDKEANIAFRKPGVGTVHATKATVFLIALMLVLMSEGSAQAVATRESTVGALEAGQRVRVRAADALSIEGVFLGLEGPDMLLSTTRAGPTQRVPIDRLEALWVRKRATRKGALIGAITGGAVGIGFGLFIGEVLCNNPDCEAGTFEAAALVGAFGAGAGAAGGALIGFLVRGWSAIWP